MAQAEDRYHDDEVDNLSPEDIPYVTLKMLVRVAISLEELVKIEKLNMRLKYNNHGEY